MDDKEAILLTSQAFQLGLKMRDAIVESDSIERKFVREEWLTLSSENSDQYATLFLAYRRGLEAISETA